LAALLAAPLKKPIPKPGERPVVYAGHVGAAVSKALIGWSLKNQAAWALEPYRDAVLATVLWTRPHVFLATSVELKAVLEHWGRSARRHSRLRAVVVVGDLDPGFRETTAEVLKCPVLAWRL